MTSVNVMPGAEPFHFEGSDVGVLLSHGFTGTTQSMRYLGEQLHRRGGFNVLAPRLAGHGVSPEAMEASRAAEWVASIDEALATLRSRCRRVFMAGLSMGGTLTLLSAARHPDIAGIVPINAAVALNNAVMAGLAFGSDAPRFLPGVGSDIKAPGVTELAYAQFPSSALRELYALMGITRDLLPQVRCPALVMVAPADHVVPPDNGELVLGAIASADKQLVTLDDSFHVATLDNDKDRIVELTLAFVQRLAE